MPVIYLTTNINAPIEIVFDLSRSIDLHQISTEQTNEKAIAGRIRGLIQLGETVTWQAKHFGITQHLTSAITEMQRPHYFVDEMTKGIFKSMHHQHRFKMLDVNTTEMVDVFKYSSPLGILGVVADNLFLVNYMRQLLLKRNDCIKLFAENNRWQEVLQRSHS